MNIEPCVRLGIRISPKISEKPADNRNNRPPNVTLLTVSSSQNVISADLVTCHAPRKRSIQVIPTGAVSALRDTTRSLITGSSAFADDDRTASALRQWRIIARIDRVREVFLLRPIPELADVLVGLDGLVPEFQAVFGAFGANAADVEIADHVAEMIELERPARRVGEAHRLERRHELLLVGGVAGRLQRRFDHLAIDIEQPRILARYGVVVLQHAVDEALV